MECWAYQFNSADLQHNLTPILNKGYPDSQELDSWPFLQDGDLVFYIILEEFPREPGVNTHHETPISAPWPWPSPATLRAWPSHCQTIWWKTACHLWCASYPSPQLQLQRSFKVLGVLSRTEHGHEVFGCWNGTFKQLKKSNDLNMTTLMKIMPGMCSDSC